MLDESVAQQSECGNKWAESVSRGHMPPQKGLPYVTTSISGITSEDWDSFKARADAEGMKYRVAIAHAVTELALAVRRGDPIDWMAIKVAPSRSVRIGVDLREEVRALADEFGYRQNVILATAMLRWANKN